VWTGVLLVHVPAGQILTVLPQYSPSLMPLVEGETAAAVNVMWCPVMSESRAPVICLQPAELSLESVL
jgi:hypothetical protein